MANKTLGKKISLERGAFPKKEVIHSEEKNSKKSTKEDKLINKFVSENKKKGLRIFVAGGSRSGNSEVYVEEAYKLGATIGKMGFKLDFGLSSQGIMGAVAKGVMDTYDSDDKKSPINAITTDIYLSFYKNDEILNQLENIVVAKTLEERKRMLLDADFIVFAPGGIGTLDELVYDCVAMQDGMLDAKPFILFNVKSFFYHILEYLKHINTSGFADKMPFIVVDNIHEAEIVFEMLKDEQLKNIKLDTLYSKVRNIIYMLPYLVKERMLNPEQSAGEIISKTRKALKNANKSAKLEKLIEREYLRKETDRMYQRLAHGAKDVSFYGEKLEKLLTRVLSHQKQNDYDIFE